MTRNGRFVESLYRRAPSVVQDLAPRIEQWSKGAWASQKAMIVDAGTLATATVVSQGLRIAILPALSRLYAPAEFGIFQIFMSILGAAGLISTAGYDKAVVLASSERRAMSVMLVGCLTAVAVATAAWIAMALSGASVAVALNSPNLAFFLFALLPIGILAIGLGENARYYATRQRRFGMIAKALIAQAIVTATIQAGLGFFPAIGAGGLIVGRVAGIVLLGGLLWSVSWRPVFAGLREIRWPSLRDSALRYRKFPMVVTPTTVFSQSVYIGPIFLVAMYFSPEDVGFFGVVMLLLSAPMQFVGSAVEQVFYRNATEERLTTGACPTSVKQAFVLLTVIAGAFGLLLILLAKPAIAVILGQNWAAVGDILLWMTPMIVLNLVGMPLQPSFVVMGYQSLQFAHQAVRSLASVGALWFAAAYTGDLRATVMAYAIMEVAMHSIGILLVFYVSGIRPSYRKGVSP